MPRTLADNPFRVKLADGSAVERTSRVRDGKRVGVGAWFWVVYDPDRRPARLKINLRTNDKAAAVRIATGHVKRRMAGAFDPWGEAAQRSGTMAEAVEAYLSAQTRAGRAASTVATAARLLGEFARTVPAGTSPRHVERRHVERFLNAPTPAGGEKAAATKQRYRAVLLHFFGFCVAQGLATVNPAQGVERPAGRPNRRDHLTRDEFAALRRSIEAAEVLEGQDYGWLLDWLTFGVNTGLRPGEQQALTWGAVRLAEGAVLVGKGHRTKTAGSVRQVPLSPAARAVLERRAAARRGEGDGEPVFTLPGGGPVALDYLSKRLAHYADAAGIPKRVTGYALRHTFGTWALSGGASAYHVARLLGTSVQMIERHYGHEDPAAGRAIIAAVFGADEAAVERAG